MNNKGQVLVMFILLVPLLFIIISLVIDIGNLVLKDNEIDNISYIVLDYALDNIDEADVLTKSTLLFMENKNDIVIDSLDIKEGKIYLSTTYKVEGIVSGLVDIKIFTLNNKYVAYLENYNKVIEELG